MKNRWMFCLLLAGLVLAPPPRAEAMQFTKETWHEDAAEVVTPFLHSAFIYFGEPTSAWYMDQLGGAAVEREAFVRFAETVAGATYAAFVYTYHREGVQHSRIYFARSGSMAPRHGLPSMRGSIESYFPPFDGVEVRSTIILGERSRIRFTAVEGDDRPDARRNDAEYQAIRTIERDIISGAVTPNGTVVAYVSRPPCTSCESAMRTFAEMYDINMHVNHLPGQGTSIHQKFRRSAWRYMDTLWAKVGSIRPGPRPTPAPTDPPGPGAPGLPAGSLAGACTAIISG
jgi:hypothetical protein